MRKLFKAIRDSSSRFFHVLIAVLAVCALACAPMFAFAAPDDGGGKTGSANPAITPEEASASGEAKDTSEPLDEPGNAISTSQLPDSSFLYDTSIAALGSADSYYDGQEVQVMGEAVGEAIRVAGDEDHRWVVLSSPEDNASVTTYMRVSDARKIDTFGVYGVKGTVLKVRGTFNLVCKEHEGESDLHVESVVVVEAGREHPDVFDIRNFIPGAALIFIGLILMLVVWRMRERQR